MVTLKCPLIILFCAAALLAQNTTLTGTVKNADGSLAVGLTVQLSGQISSVSTVTDAAGNYSFSTQTGQYSQLRVQAGDPMTNTRVSGYPAMFYDIASQNFAISGPTVLDVTLPAIYAVNGVVRDAGTQAPLSKVLVRSNRWSGNMTQDPSDFDTTDASGAFTLYVQTGATQLSIDAPPASYAAVESVLTVTAPITVNLALVKTLALSGTVLSWQGNPLAKIIVGITKGVSPNISFQAESLTHADGSFKAPVLAGAYKIDLHTNSMNRAVGCPETFDSVIIGSLSVAKDTNLSLTAPRFAAVRCSVFTAGRVPAAGYSIRSVIWTQQYQYMSGTTDVAVTDASGACRLYTGYGLNRFTITPTTGSGYTEIQVYDTISADTALVVNLTLPPHIKGSVTTHTGAPAPHVTVRFSNNGPAQSSAITDSTGKFSNVMIAGKYAVSLWLDATPGNPAGAPPIAGVPRDLTYSYPDSVTLVDSAAVAIVLPNYPVMSGTVADAQGAMLTGVQVTAGKWSVGIRVSPGDQVITDNQGRYALSLDTGVQFVDVKPPSSQPGLFTPVDFMENLSANLVRPIIIPDPSRAVTRVQPSVVTAGDSGMLMINGVNGNFTNGSVTVDLGDGVTVRSIEVVSDITLRVRVAIDPAATACTRDVAVHAGGQTVVGSALFTVTLPASAKVQLDQSGKTTKAVQISDGTGTLLNIPAGTSVSLPPASDSTISYTAPILAGADSVAANQTKLTNVQRELQPSGLVFGDSVTIVSHYQNQDVVGLNEATLTPVYYVDSSASTPAQVGDSMTIVSRDTAANLITFQVKHFSMFRLASPSHATAVKSKLPVFSRTTVMGAFRNPLRRHCAIPVYVAAQDKLQTRLSLYTPAGAFVCELFRSNGSDGLHMVRVENGKNSVGASGVYLLRLEAGKIASQRSVVIMP